MKKNLNAAKSWIVRHPLAAVSIAVVTTAGVVAPIAAAIAKSDKDGSTELTDPEHQFLLQIPNAYRDSVLNGESHSIRGDVDGLHFNLTLDKSLDA